MATQLLDSQAYGRSLALRDLTDAALGPHAMQLLVQQALDALQASFFINPFDYKLHTQAGELSVELKDFSRAVTEFQVALALAPIFYQGYLSI